YTENKELLHNAYNFQFLRADELTPALIRDTVEEWEATEAWPSWSFSNHDVRRAVTRWGGQDGGEALAKQLLTLLCCLRGTVFLYQGDELGLPQAELAFEDLRDPEAIRFWPEDLGRDGARTPMPWTANAPHAGFTTGQPWMKVEKRHKLLAAYDQNVDQQSVLHHAKEVIELRRKSEALRIGSIAFDDAEDQLLCFTRQLGDERLWCVFNLSVERVRLKTRRGLTIRPPSTGSALEGQDIVLAPHAALIAQPMP
ncbi:MAG: alpha-amylase family glycosyl hydrolase, partial [Pseudomonadota bacterium]